MSTNTDRPIRLMQRATVLYETSYTRDEALDLLKKSGSPGALAWRVDQPTTQGELGGCGQQPLPGGIRRVVLPTDR
jgi:hypothetical protein